MDNVLITGGTGFCGFWMRKTQPKDLKTFYLNREKYQHDWWEKIGVYKYVVHLAPIEPTRAINCARRNDARLLYASSGVIYHPESDKTEYRENKILWEQECQDSGVNVSIARLFTFVGERLSRDHAIARFEWAARNKLPLRIWGNGSCVRSYMHGYELGRWLWAILLHGERGEAYDVGSDEPVTMLELARKFSDNIIIEGGTDAMPVYLPPDTNKTRKLLT